MYSHGLYSHGLYSYGLCSSVPKVPTLFMYGRKKPFMFHCDRWAERLAARGDGMFGDRSAKQWGDRYVQQWGTGT